MHTTLMCTVSRVKAFKLQIDTTQVSFTNFPDQARHIEGLHLYMFTCTCLCTSMHGKWVVKHLTVSGGDEISFGKAMKTPVY